MLLWQFFLFMLLANKVEGEELNKKCHVLKRTAIIGGETSPNVSYGKQLIESENNTICSTWVVKSSAELSRREMKSTAINHVKRLNKYFTSRLVATDMGLVVGAMAWQTLEQRVSGCNFVLVTSNTQNPLVSYIIRYSTMASHPVGVIDLNRFNQTTSQRLLRSLWGGATTTCRTLFIDLTTDDAITDLFRFLETSRLWVWSEVWVVLVGSISKAKDALQHQALRNVLQPIFLGLQDVTLRDLNTQSLTLKQNTWQNDQKSVESLSVTKEKGTMEVVTVFSRCLYCKDGEPQVRLISLWPLGSKLLQHFNPFPNQLANLHGRLLRAVAISYFPYNDYQLDTDEPATTVTLLDSIDKRLLETFSVQLNFTYEVRAPWDMQFGIPTENGNWTGMLGTIQHNKADFCTFVSPNPGRIKIIDPIRSYETDIMALVSLKPKVLPRYLVVIRPFTVDVWLYLLLVIMIWGTSLWLLQKVWSSFSGKQGITLNTAIFYSWAVILEDPPPKPPTNSTGQMLVIWWLVACLVITTGFRSSLVGHLAKESRSSPIDTLQDMIDLNNWRWSIEIKSLTAYPGHYFRSSNDPSVKYIYKHLEAVENNDEAFQKILKGGYSYFALKNVIGIVIASYYTNNFGETPYYISKGGLAMFPDFSWGLSKGAPYRNRFNMLMIRLQEAGITEYWTKDIIASRVKENRKKVLQQQQQKDSEQNVPAHQITEKNQIVLGISHMMGVFFTLLFGYIISFFTLMGEQITHSYKSGIDS